MKVTRHVVFRGRVQGVGFRAFVAEEAEQGAIEGWVRNRRDGTVEAVFSGEAEAVGAAIAACREGPRLSHVEAIDQREGTADEFKLRGRERFAVLRTL